MDKSKLPVKIDADEFDRLEAAKAEERGALEQEAQAEREEQAGREVLEKAWAEQEDYRHAMSEFKDKAERRTSRRRILARAAAVLLVAGTIGAVLYGVWPVPKEMSEAEALRIASEARVRREEEVRAKRAAETASKDSEKTPEAKAAAGPAADSTAKARAVADAKKAAGKASALEAERAIEEQRRNAGLAAQAQAMVQAEERARAVSALAPKEAPRALQRPGSIFQDCAECPRMVVIPAGEFTMGSPASEAGRGVDEGPLRQVSIARPFALGRSEVTVAEFRRFVEESGYKTEAERDTRTQGCSGFIYADPAASSPAESFTSWRSPGLPQAQADPHPVLCVSWNDARAYAQWLSRKTGKRYRLPTEAEWEYAARGGSVTARPWGDDPAQACRFANVADQSRFQTWTFGQKHECTDGHYFTAPAGGYAPNRFGLYDMLGNVWEWTEDCWNAGYAGAPSDAMAWLAGDCAQRVLRGGSWSTVPRFARSATRHKNSADYRDNLTGIRLARVLD